MRKSQTNLRPRVSKLIKANTDKSPEEQRDIILAELGVTMEHLKAFGMVRHIEAVNEPFRRRALADRRDRRHTRKLMSTATRRNVGRGFRRIIYSKITPATDFAPGFERQFHATKGWRTYRNPQ